MTEPIEKKWPVPEGYPLETLNLTVDFNTDSVMPDNFLLMPDHSFTFLVGEARTPDTFKVNAQGKVQIINGELVLPRGEDNPLVKFEGLTYDAGLFKPLVRFLGTRGDGIQLGIDGLSLYIDDDGEELYLEQEVLGLPFFDQDLKSRLEHYIGPFKKFPKKVPVHALIAGLQEILANPPGEDPGMKIRTDVPLHKIASGGTTHITGSIDAHKPLLLPDGTRVVLGDTSTFDIKNTFKNPLALQDWKAATVAKQAKFGAFKENILPFYATIEFLYPNGTTNRHSLEGDWADRESEGLGLTAQQFHKMILRHIYEHGRVTNGAEILAPRPQDPWNMEDVGDDMNDLYRSKKKLLPEIRLRPAGEPRDYLVQAGEVFKKAKDKFTAFGESLIHSATEMTANFDLRSIINPEGVEAFVSLKGENVSFVNELASPTQDWAGIRTMEELMSSQPLRMITQKHVTNGKISLTGDVNIPKGYRLAGFELPEIALTLTGPTEMLFQDLSFGYDAKTQTISTSGQSKGVYDVSNPKIMGLELDARLQGAVTMTGLNGENSDFAWGFHFEGEQTVTLNIERPVDIFPTEVPKEQTHVTVKKMDYRIGKKTDGTERVVGTAALKVEGITPQMNTSVNIELWE